MSAACLLRTLQPRDTPPRVALPEFDAPPPPLALQASPWLLALVAAAAYGCDNDDLVVNNPPPGRVLDGGAGFTCRDDPRLGSDCTEGMGVCQATGRWICTADERALVCDVQLGAPGAETCANIGVDDDCDGDEMDVEGLQAACSTGEMGRCATGTQQCVAAAMRCLRDFEPGRETCSNRGVDDDCDGDAADLEVDEGAHLLISEIVTTPVAREMIEIYNPTTAEIDLSTYGLTDFKDYHRAPDRFGGGFDFLVLFPEGARIGACARQVVAVHTADRFFAAFGQMPDYELLKTTDPAEEGNPMVPDMRASLGKSVPGNRGLTNDSEMVALFDLSTGVVRDVDYLVWGGNTDVFADKTGLRGFLPDTPAASQDALPLPRDGKSLHRCTNGEAAERSTFGNGIGGHDETSERLNLSFIVTATPTPGLPDPACPAEVKTCDDLVEVGGACTAGVGGCAAAGTWSCGESGANLTCLAAVGAPSAETCADLGTDEDCDGDVTDVDGVNQACNMGGCVQACVATTLMCVEKNAHLLLTEVVVRPDGAEMIELANPTTAVVDLSVVALADFDTYYRAPAGPYETASSADFIVRFPDGAQLLPCARVTVAVDGAQAFFDVTGGLPDYEIVTSTASSSSTAIDRADVPNMVDDLGKRAGGARSLTDGSEMLVAFVLDAAGAHRDLDYVSWGNGAGGRVDKSLVTGFAADTATVAQASLGRTHLVGGSFHRCDDEETGEARGSGNGVTADDETSEPFDTTWYGAKHATPGARDPACQ